jgi:predicted HicB family RNase H-like nuclease
MNPRTATEDDGADFAELLGKFHTHADIQKRHRAERLASMRPGDKRRRRGPPRAHQFNVRISTQTQTLAHAMCKAEGWSQADLVEAAITALAKAKEGAKAKGHTKGKTA